MVTLVDDPVGLHVDVVEVDDVVTEVVRQFQEGIHITASGGDEQRGLVLQDRPFHSPFGGEQADGGSAVPLPFVASPARHVEHCR